MRIIYKNCDIVIKSKKAINYTLFFNTLNEVENPEYKNVLLDIDNNVLCGKKTDGTIYDAISGTDLENTVVTVGGQSATLKDIISYYKNNYLFIEL